MVSIVKKELLTWTSIFSMNNDKPNEPYFGLICSSTSSLLPRIELSLVKNPTSQRGLESSLTPSTTIDSSITSNSIRTSLFFRIR
jgi:hypothetical protein